MDSESESESESESKAESESESESEIDSFLDPETKTATPKTDAETSEGVDADSAAKRNPDMTRGFIQEQAWNYAWN
jgi:hypothetical protein